MDSARPFDLSWRSGAAAHGVRLCEYGDGVPVFLFPGMEGSGESCLHLAVPVIQRAAAVGQPYKLVLVDYSQEAHGTLDQLVATAHGLIRDAAAGARCVVWGQSFGNLLATGVVGSGAIVCHRLVLVSPFTALSTVMTGLSMASLFVTPTFLYRASSGLLGRYMFGPVGDQAQHPFFDALRQATPHTVRRRTSWLYRHDFSQRFRDTPAPTKVWLGKEDRLVNLEQQQTFFATLTMQRRDYALSMIEGSGHVLLPRHLILSVCDEIFRWLTEADTAK